MNSSPSGTGASEVGWQDPELGGQVIQGQGQGRDDRDFQNRKGIGGSPLQ